MQGGTSGITWPSSVLRARRWGQTQTASWDCPHPSPHVCPCMIMPLSWVLEGHGFPQGNQSHLTARAPGRLAALGTGSFLIAKSTGGKEDWAHIRCISHWRLQAFCAGSLQHFANAEEHTTHPPPHGHTDRPAALTVQGLGLGVLPSAALSPAW